MNLNNSGKTLNTSSIFLLVNYLSSSFFISIIIGVEYSLRVTTLTMIFLLIEYVIVIISIIALFILGIGYFSYVLMNNLSCISIILSIKLNLVFSLLTSISSLFIFFDLIFNKDFIFGSSYSNICFLWLFNTLLGSSCTILCYRFKQKLLKEKNNDLFKIIKENNESLIVDSSYN